MVCIERRPIVSVMIAKMGRVCFWRGSERRFDGYGPYHTGFDESGWVTFYDYRERLIRNWAGIRWAGTGPEAVTPVGKILYADFDATHRKIRPSDPDRDRLSGAAGRRKRAGALGAVLLWS